MSKCTQKTLCVGLDRYLNKRKYGFVTQTTINIKTGEFGKTPITYRDTAKDNGLVLNYCPWCGVRIYP